MRPRFLALLLALAPLAGCIDTPAAADESASGAAAPAATPVAETEPVELASFAFTLGPVGDTPVSNLQVVQDVVVPEGAKRVVLQLHVTQGASVDFSVTGIEGCEITVSGPANLAGREESPECAPAPGPYTLTVTHTSGYVDGHVAVLAD